MKFIEEPEVLPSKVSCGTDVRKGWPGNGPCRSQHAKRTSASLRTVVDFYNCVWIPHPGAHLQAL